MNQQISQPKLQQQTGLKPTMLKKQLSQHFQTFQLQCGLTNNLFRTNQHNNSVIRNHTKINRPY